MEKGQCRSRRKLGSLFDDLSSAREAKHPTYRFLKIADTFALGDKLQMFRSGDTQILAKKLGLSVSYLRGCRALAKKMGVPSNMQYALENYQEIRVAMLLKIAGAKKRDYRTVRRMLEREVGGLPQRADHGSQGERAVTTISAPSLGNWGSAEASPGLEFCAEQLHATTHCRTRVNQLDNGIIEVSFKCLTAGDFDRLFALINR